MPTFLWDNPGQQASSAYDWFGNDELRAQAQAARGAGAPGQALNRETGRRQPQAVQSRQNQGRGLAARRAGAAKPTEQRVTGAPNNLPTANYGLTDISGSSPITETMPEISPFVANRVAPAMGPSGAEFARSYNTSAPQALPPSDQLEQPEAPISFEGGMDSLAGRRTPAGQNLEPNTGQIAPDQMDSGMANLAAARQQFAQATGKVDKYAELKARFAAPPDPTAVANSELKHKGFLGRIGQVGIGALKGLAIGGPGGAIAGAILGGTGDIYRTERVRQLQAQDARNRQAALDQFAISKEEEDAQEKERQFGLEQEKYAGYRQVNATREARLQADKEYRAALISGKDKDRVVKAYQAKQKADDVYRNKLMDFKLRGGKLPPEVEREWDLENFEGPQKKTEKPIVNARSGQLLIPDKDAPAGYRYVDIPGFKKGTTGKGGGKLKKSDVRDQVLEKLEENEKKNYMEEKAQEAAKAFKESPEYAAATVGVTNQSPAYIASQLKRAEAAFTEKWFKDNKSKIDRGFNDRLRENSAGRNADARRLVNEFMTGKGKSKADQEKQRNYDIAHPDIENDYNDDDDSDYDDLDEED